jgi:hypothetical protein
MRAKARCLVRVGRTGPGAGAVDGRMGPADLVASPRRASTQLMGTDSETRPAAFGVFELNGIKPASSASPADFPAETTA